MAGGNSAGLFGWAHGGSLKPVKELVRAASLTVALTVEGDMTSSCGA